jgi:hypothetical protein
VHRVSSSQASPSWIGVDLHRKLWRSQSPWLQGLSRAVQSASTRQAEAVQTPARQAIVVQSAPLLQVCPSRQGLQPPPQSTSLSSWFLSRSSQLGSGGASVLPLLSSGVSVVVITSGIVEPTSVLPLDPPVLVEPPGSSTSGGLHAAPTAANQPNHPAPTRPTTMHPRYRSGGLPTSAGVAARRGRRGACSRRSRAWPCRQARWPRALVNACPWGHVVTGGAAQGPCGSGRKQVMMVPPPSRASMRRLPPWASTISRHSASPRPEPVRLVE